MCTNIKPEIGGEIIFDSAQRIRYEQPQTNIG